MAIHPQERDIDCYVCQFSKLQGFAGITPGRVISRSTRPSPPAPARSAWPRTSKRNKQAAVSQAPRKPRTSAYQLNLRTFLRAVFQYTDVDRDLSLYDQPEDFEARSQELFTQLLFSYKLNPRTVLFLGYSDNYLGDDAIELTQESRALFLKIGYAWVL